MLRIPPSRDTGHALCLARVTDMPAGFMSYMVTEGSVSGVSIPEGRYVPVDYEVVGGISNAMNSSWSLGEVHVPERIYVNAM